MRDDDVRSSCFAALDVLQAKWGQDTPWQALSEGFNFRGVRVPFLNRAYGIYRAADVQRGPAALSVNSSFAQRRYQDEETPVHIEGEIERRYVVRQVRQRIHQLQFRGVVLPAYRDRCAICCLRESRLLDAAHIVGDLEERGEAVVSNGLALCSIHHRAFDQSLVGVSPDYKVRVSERLLDDEDGPMLELLKGFHDQPIVLPARRAWRPDPERLAVRFEQFRAAG